MRKCKAQPNLVATQLGGWVARRLAKWLASSVAGWLGGRLAGRLEPPPHPSPPLTGKRPLLLLLLLL